MKARLALITGIILLGAFFLRAQDNFQITYSSSGNKVIEWMVPSNDGNLILAGNTDSFDSNGDGLILKTDQNGNIIWSKIFGGPGWDKIVRMISCTDGGYVAIGFTNSYGEGERDAWIIRLNEQGGALWSYCLGTSDRDEARGIIQTQEGDFIVFGGDQGYTAAFILMLNSNGELLWMKEYWLGIVFWFNDVYKIEGGGFYFIGGLNYDGFGKHDSFILQTDSIGNIIRCKVYGDQDDDAFRCMIPYQDGFLMVGDTWSWQNHQLGWLVKINSELEIKKAVVIGDENLNQSLESASFISNSIFATIKLTDGNAFIIELDSSLNINRSWQFNAGNSTYSSHAISLNDSSIVFTGSTTNAETLKKDIYLTKFHPGDYSYDCNTVQHEAFASVVGMQSDDLYINETENNWIYQEVNIQSYEIPLQINRLCIPPPIADFLSADQACVNVPVSINNQSQNSETYQWYFEGAIPATSDSIDPGDIIYENPGYYNIKLIVNNEGGTDSIVKHITIYQGIEFSLGPDTTIPLSGTLQFITIGEFDSYLWSTGDTTSYLFVPATELQLGNNQIWLEIQEGPCVASDSININVVDNSSIDENIHPDILLYPNPAMKSSRITLKSAEIPASVVFYNQMGAEVLRVQPLDNLLDIIGLEPGVYMVEITFRGYILKRRLIIL